jgi:hypothetical protein
VMLTFAEIRGKPSAALIRRHSRTA